MYLLKSAYIRRKISTLAVIAFVLVVSSLLSGCGADSDELKAEQSGKIKIVATTTMLADLTRNICGDEAEIHGLMGPGIDPHLYQASAGDVNKLQQADIVIYNGLHLEGKMGEVFSTLTEQGKKVICIEDGLDTSKLLKAEDDVYDPHIWFDVTLWKEAAYYVTSQLNEYENTDKFTPNYTAYAKELDELDEYIVSRTEELDESKRVLITAHDAFQYFGSRYGFNVMGLQGISTDAEAGAGDVMGLAQFIADNRIKAIFIESSVPPKTVEALQAAVKARGFDVEIGGELYSDSLGDKESGTDTYISTFKANIDTIVDSLKVSKTRA